MLANFRLLLSCGNKTWDRIVDCCGATGKILELVHPGPWGLNSINGFALTEQRLFDIDFSECGNTAEDVTL